MYGHGCQHSLACRQRRAGMQELRISPALVMFRTSSRGPAAERPRPLRCSRRRRRRFSSSRVRRPFFRMDATLALNTSMACSGTAQHIWRDASSQKNPADPSTVPLRSHFHAELQHFIRFPGASHSSPV